MTRRVTMRDPGLPHQLFLHFIANKGRIAVGCNCTAVLETRSRWDLNDVWAVYNAHLPAEVAR